VWTQDQAGRTEQELSENISFTMPDQIVITEKSSQTKNVRAAVGGRYGTVVMARAE
jgi:hypothetical protein